MEQTKIIFKIVELLLHLTREKRKRTMCLIGRLVDSFSNLSIQNENWIPADINDAQAMCLAGQHSVFFNLPGIKVKNINDHAVLSIRDVVNHVLGLGVPLQWLQDASGMCNHDGINGSKRAQDMLDSALLNCNSPNQTAVGG